MHEEIRVLVLGTGQMGSGIIRLVLEKQGLGLVGVFARRASRSGLDVGRVVGSKADLGIRVSTDLVRLIEQTQPHVAIQATCSAIDNAMGEVAMLVRHGVRVVSIAEQMACPARSSPAFAEEIHWLAVSRGAALVGTGINPGFVMDLLVITLSGVCADIESISAERVNDLSPYGPTVLASQGVGLSPAAFAEGLESGTVVGHIGFPESIHLIAKAIGCNIERIEEKCEPIIAGIARETPFVTVQPGQVAGCLQTAVAYRQDEPVITLRHPQQIQPWLEGVQTGDKIEIKGNPDVVMAGHPEIPGGQATCALAVNMIPRILSAAPGLHTRADLPVPAAILGDARQLVRDRRPGH